jgi:GNAT superfamily N-acetyltransferase
VQLVELGSVSDGDWRQVIAGEPEPWGGVGEALRWRERSHNIGLRDERGDLVALAGLVPAEVRVGEARLEVAGIGGVIVTRSARGRGLARVLVARLLQIGRELELDRAMLFCLQRNVGLYAKFGFRLIEEPVFAQQPGGLIEVPLRAMWRPLISAASWPGGRVELVGEPF